MAGRPRSGCWTRRCPGRCWRRWRRPGGSGELAGRFFSDERLLGAELARSKPAWVAAKLLLAPRPGAMARYALRRVGNVVRARD
ncbi:hypothetical protein ACLESD_14755 [Pyxidicoccus sp. 3LFB2]